MQKRRSQEVLYPRGQYWLAWDRRADGSLRSPYIAIFWYDRAAGRVRSASTRTADLEQAKATLDARYLEETSGETICPACGQRRQHGSVLLADAITNYMTLVGEKRDSAEAIGARLDHVVAYMETLADNAVYAADVDERWIAGFRSWSLAQPIVTVRRMVPRDKNSPFVTSERMRSHGTVEASVRQLAAAVNLALDPTGKTKPARFSARKPEQVSRTPMLRVKVPMLAAMFRYATHPDHRERRSNLHRFLIGSVVTCARPDAVLDISVDPARGQWAPQYQVLNLNPKGRAKTDKRRAVIKLPAHGARVMDAISTIASKARSQAERRRLSWLVATSSIKSAWVTMCKELGLPTGDGEAGTKLVRRSVSTLLRGHGVSRDDIELLLGHRVYDPVTDLYAPFDPEYLATAVSALESICAEIEALTPEAFTVHHHWTFTGDASNVVDLKTMRKAADNG